MRFLFVGDRLSDLKPMSDTSFLLVRAVRTSGDEAYWCEPRDLQLVDSQLHISAARCVKSEKAAVPELATVETLSIEDFSVVLIRKDPPFDASYVKLCWLLALAENKVLMFNKPSQLLRYHEKLVPLEAFYQGFLNKEDLIPTYYRSYESFLREITSEKAISKPFLGYGGRSIHRWKISELTKDKIDLENDILQPYESNVETKGDRRVFFLGGKYLGDVVRLPKKGDFVANLSQGGSAAKQPLEKEQREVVDRLGTFLQKNEIAFAGADLIGTKITEVNITSPTGLTSMDELDGEDYGAKVVSYIKGRLS